MSLAEELLLKVKSGGVRGSIKLKDVEEILSNDDFTAGTGLLTATPDGNTLIHLAAACTDTNVLPLVSQAYKRAKFFTKVMRMANSKGHTPIHIATRFVRFDNTVLLYNDCQELCPEALKPSSEEGPTLFHSALGSPENLSTVKFLLSQENCLPLLLHSCKDATGQSTKLKLPLDVATNLVKEHEGYLKKTEIQYREWTGTKYNIKINPMKKLLEKAREMLSLISQSTMEQKAEQGKESMRELERQKVLERQKQLNSEIEGLIQADSWQEVVEKYLEAESEETQKLTLIYLSETLKSDALLPPLSEKTLQVMVNLMNSSPVEEPVIPSLLKVLNFYTRNVANNRTIVQAEKTLPVLPKILDVLCSVDHNLQCACAHVLLNFFSNLPRDPALTWRDDSNVIQPLLLVKHFSLCEEARRLAGGALGGLGVEDSREPDPGTWSNQHVSFWIESIAEVDCRSEYSASFSTAGIDGLHLLELSSMEMSGLGVKFVSHQRKLSAAIDDLRRRNMRSMVGKKDIFLSYAHVDIKFARKIKKALNDAGYSVWIDGAGIRAGHKWRNEIADGIQSCSCFLVLLSPRCSNSVYCQDEIGLAEEYKKPILTIKYKLVQEMDPGLKLTLQRRQWLDFTDKSTFPSDQETLIDAVDSLIGAGSGADCDLNVPEKQVEAAAHKPVMEKARTLSSPDDTQFMGAWLDEGARQLVMKVLREEMAKLREEVMTEMQRMNSRLDDLSHRIDRQR